MARKKRRRSSQGVALDHKKLGALLMIIGGLYFFAFFLASQSPLINIFHSGTYVAFGQAGTMIFFGISVLAGLLFILKGGLVRTIAKQYILLLMIISAILNFPILDGTATNYEQFGGFLSWPLLWGLEQMFGVQPMAIKVFVVLMLVGLIAWIVYTFNLKVPSMTINLPDREKTPRSKKQKTTGNESSGSLFGGLIKTKRSQPNDDIRQAVADVTSQNHTEPTSSTVASNSLLKDIIKGTAKTKAETKKKEQIPVVLPSFPKDKPTFDVGLLTSKPSNPDRIDQELLMERAQALQSKLAEFNVPVSIEGFNIGPTVIQIKVKPHAGVKVSALENLKNDLSLALRTKSLRIISPIPGTDCIGVEIPNPKPSTVWLGDALRSTEFRQSIAKSQTNITLGQGIDGNFVIKSLEEMPHLLVAGATGSGKSVGVNDFILSLMYQNSPEELKFLMVDPKQVELEFYSGLPYMLAPIVVKPESALKILQRSVEEMEQRYALLRTNRVKNLVEYNQKHPEGKMFRIVIVIDELADLMMTGSKKDCENAITRIAQKARAVGMHLILATQRPSVNVITGLIKANVPTRVAFGVVSQIDSRTILDAKGAEDLVGRGDLLYTDPKTKTPLRVQAPFVTTEETEAIVAALKEKYMNGLTESDIYHQDIMDILDGKTGGGLATAGGGGSVGDDEELIEQAIEIIAQTKKASATMLQRKLNIGFARAARIMDTLEERGAIGPADGAKPRKIYL